MSRLATPFQVFLVLALSACGGDGGPTGAPGGALAATAAALPAAPGNVRLQRLPNGPVRVDYEHDGVAVTRFEFLRQVPGTTTWTLVRATDNVSVRAMRDDSYDPARNSYYYRLDACNESGCASSPVLYMSGLRILAPYQHSNHTSVARTEYGVLVRWADAGNDKNWDFGTNSLLPGWKWSQVVTRTGGSGGARTWIIPSHTGDEACHQRSTFGTPNGPCLFYSLADSSITERGQYTYTMAVRNLVGPGPAATLTLWAGAIPSSSAYSASLLADGKVALSWTHEGMGITYWNIHRRPQGTAEWTILRLNDASLRTYQDRTYDNSVDAWEWAVQGCDAYGCGALSSVGGLTGLRITSPAAAPVLTSNQPTRVRIDWQNGTGPIYRTWIMRRESGATTRVKVGQVPLSRTYFVDTTALATRTYFYSLTASNAVGEAGPSPERQVGPSSSPTPAAVFTDSVNARIPYDIFPSFAAWAHVRTPAGMPTWMWFEMSLAPAMGGAAKSAERVVGPDTAFLHVYNNVPQQDTTYYVRAAARTADGLVSYGQVLAFRHQGPAPPGSVAATLRADGRVGVSYTHDGQFVREWRLFRRTKGTTAWTRTKRIEDPARRYIVDAEFAGDPATQEWRLEACRAFVCRSSGVFALP
jgi:hypothetical protein